MKYLKIVKEIAQHPDKTINQRIKLVSKKLNISEKNVKDALIESELKFIDYSYSNNKE